MNLCVFHAADGDCLLLSSADRQHYMLVDGGRRGSYKSETRRQLADLRGEGKTLDVVCVSHIDDDHISGILQLVEDEIEWRAFEFRQSLDDNAPPPSMARPPEIGQFWHNALFRLVGHDMAPQIEAALATSASLLSGAEDEAVLDLASHYDNLATGERSSMELSRRISDEQLAIPLNTPAGGDLIKRGIQGDTIQIGGLTCFVLGPSDDDLLDLRDSWQAWLDESGEAVAKLHAEMLADEQNLGTLSPRLVANPIGAALGEGLTSITEPNLASLTLLVEGDDQTVLLAGDADSREILEGLEHHGKLDAQGKIHVTVLKVQHHGALANVTAEFVERVTADHYVFCGNGAHDNPEKEVVQAFARAHIEGMDTEFKFWFSSSSETPDGSKEKKRKAHMEMIEAEVEMLKAQSGGLMQAEFIARGHMDVL